MRIRRSLRVALAGVFCLAAASPAAAQYTSSAAAIRGMDERFRIDIGGFFQKFDTTLRLDSPSLGTGTEINLENDLGQNANKTTFRADGYWRFGPHASLQFAFLSWNRSNSTALAKDIQFGDHVYHAGATASSKLRITDAEIYYAYSLVNNGETELGMMLGVSALFSSASFDATGYITGPDGTTVTGSVAADNRSLVAPIPAIGSFFRYTLLPRFFVYGRIKGLPKVTISGYRGDMLDWGAGFDYFFSQNVGIGGGYLYTKIKFAHEAADALAVNYKYSGPFVYLSLAF